MVGVEFILTNGQRVRATGTSWELKRNEDGGMDLTLGFPHRSATGYLGRAHLPAGPAVVD